MLPEGLNFPVIDLIAVMMMSMMMITMINSCDPVFHSTQQQQQTKQKKTKPYEIDGQVNSNEDILNEKTHGKNGNVGIRKKKHFSRIY